MACGQNRQRSAERKDGRVPLVFAREKRGNREVDKGAAVVTMKRWDFRRRAAILSSSLRHEWQQGILLCARTDGIVELKEQKRERESRTQRKKGYIPKNDKD